MGIVSVAADVKQVAEAIEAVQKIIDKVNPPRSVVLQVENRTSSVLRVVSSSHAHGAFALPPTLEIKPGEVDTFGSQDNEFARGTEGAVTYESTAGFVLDVTWNNPLAGENRAGTRVAGDNGQKFKATSFAGGAKQGAQMRYFVEPDTRNRNPIKRRGEGEAGAVSAIRIARHLSQQVVTAVRDASGKLKLITWRVLADGALMRTGDSGSQVGEVTDLDMARASRFVVACRTAAGTLKLISFDIDDQGAVKRVKDSGDAAGAATLLKVIALNPALILTACRAQDGSVKLIAWEMRGDGSFSRLGDSERQAGEVSEISLVEIPAAPSGDPRVVTAVRAADGSMVLIPWAIEDGGRSIRRIGFNHQQAGEATLIHAVMDPSGRLVTSMRSGAGSLVLVTWDISSDGTLTRLADNHGQAGTIQGNSLMARPDRMLSAVTNDSGNLKLIAWFISPQGAVERAADSGDQAGTSSLVSLCSEPLTGAAPIITAVRAGNGNLKLISWTDLVPA
jgi:hypothetical protein